MPPFLRPRGGGRFQATAMSVGVPLEGTDTVPGLRTLERRAAATRIDGLLNEAAKHGFHAKRRYARYRGPYLESLSLASLKAAPAPWRTFARGDTTLPCLTLPASVDALRERVEENVVAYAPNYVRVVLAVVLVAALVLWPKSVLGLAAVAAWAWAADAGYLGSVPSLASLTTHVVESQPTTSGASDAGSTVGPAIPPSLGGAAPSTPPTRAIATLTAYVIVTMTRALYPMSRGMWWGGLACAAHAALRAAPTEATAAARNGGRLTAAHTLASVMRGTSTTPGDPRRLLRELGRGCASLARAAALAARAGAAAAVDGVKLRVKAALAARPPRRLR